MKKRAKTITIVVLLSICALFALSLLSMKVEESLPHRHPPIVGRFYGSCLHLFIRTMVSLSEVPDSFKKFMNEEWLKNHLSEVVNEEKVLSTINDIMNFARRIVSTSATGQVFYRAIKDESLVMFIIISPGEDGRFAIPNKEAYIATIIYKYAQNPHTFNMFLPNIWPHKGLGDDIVFIRFCSMIR